MKTVKRFAYCYNCLRNGHKLSNCQSRACAKCHKKHNTLLHYERTTSGNSDQSTSNTIVRQNDLEVNNQLNEQSTSAQITHHSAKQSNVMRRLKPYQFMLRPSKIFPWLLIQLMQNQNICLVVQRVYHRLIRILGLPIDNVRSLLMKVENTMQNRLRTVSFASSFSKSVPVYKWNFRFSGETLANGDFLERVEELRVYRNVTHA